MKIGVVTYHEINNYGAQLQAASLQRYIESKGYEVEIVNYKPIRTRIRIFMTILRPFLKFNFGGGIKEIRKRGMFVSNILKISRLGRKSLYRESEAKKDLYDTYDVLICGSDELWNFQNYLGYLGVYALDFKVSQSTKKLSYAASLGSCEPDDSLTASLKASLSEFSNILVRDPCTLDYVESIGLTADRVLDPTFLFDFQTPEPKMKNYLMITGTLSKHQVEVAIDAAQRLGLRPVSVGCTYPGFESIYIDATPLEWVGYIKNASFHFTSLFHGAVFSLKSRTSFAVYSSPEKMQKVGSLMGLFEQTERVVSLDANVEKLLSVSNVFYPPSFDEFFDGLVVKSQEMLIESIEN